MKKMLMFALACASAMVFAQNLLKDGDFASGKFGAGWTDAKWAPAWGEKAVKDGVLTFKNDKEEQYTLTHQSLKLAPGKYTISFEAKADFVPAKGGQKKEVEANGVKRTVTLSPSAGPEICVGGKTVVGSNWGLKKNDDWKKLSRTFVVAPAKGDAAAPVPCTVYVMLRHSTGTCSFRNIVLEKAK